MQFPQSRILVFAKAPLPGRVKTRLAAHYGDTAAAAIYKTMVRHTLTVLSAAQLCPMELWCAPDSSHGFFHACRSRYGLTLHRQHGGDLGRRMHHALNSALQRSSCAVLIGSDCVSLTPADLTCALTALEQGKDAVLGPAEDGGYVLIGLRRPQPQLFRGIRWSTASVLPATRQKLQLAGLEWAELPERWDVDEPRDLQRWRAEV
jgi:rSAM/selenodomain-associated transferase 1